MKKLFICFFISLLGSVATNAQRRIPAELENNLRGKTKVKDIMAEVNRYYDYGRRNLPADASEFENNDYEWWLKWEHFAIRRLLPNGTMANFKARNYEAYDTVQKKYKTQLQNFEQQLRTKNAWAAEGRHASLNFDNLSYGNWSYIGPPSNGGAIVNNQSGVDINGIARMDRISFHPTDPNIIYTGSPSGKIYKTTNRGTSWSAIGNGLPLGVACLEVAPSDGNIIYAFSGDGDSHNAALWNVFYDNSPISQGLFKSTDGGVSWTKCADMYTGPNHLVGHQIAVSKTNSNYLFCATSEGLYRTINGGNTWQQVRSGNYFDVEFRPNVDSTVYTSTKNTVEYSSGGGRTGTWFQSTFNIPISEYSVRIELGVATGGLFASGYVYALIGYAGGGNFGGIYLSTNSGFSFARRSSTPNILGNQTNGLDANGQEFYDLAICVKPSDQNYIATGGLCVWRSNGSNGGTNMVYSSTYRESYGPITAYIHPDVHDVQYNPLNDNLYAATDGGVYVSTDDGVTWFNISNGLTGTQFYHFRMKDADGDGQMDGQEIIAGAQDNGMKYRTGSGSWRHIFCCDGFDGVIKGSNGNWVLFNGNFGQKLTTNGGQSVTTNSNLAFMPMAMDYDFDDTIYVSGSQYFRRTYDGGQNWKEFDYNMFNFIVTCPSNNAVLYGSSSLRTDLIYSSNRGVSYFVISNVTGWPAGEPVVTDCKPMPTNSGEIFASFGGYNSGVKVFRRVSPGDWVNYSGTLPNVPVHCLAVATEGVYAGTEIGVFFRAHGAADWTPFFTGMPKALITDLWVHSGGLIYAGTFGNGIWAADRHSACTDSITISGNLDGQHYYEADTIANVTATSEGGTGTDIFIKSNGFIDLLDGFEIKDTTFFQAYLGPCGTGGIPSTSFTDGENSYKYFLLEYDDRMQQLKRKQGDSYYVQTHDGVEINLSSDANLQIEIADKKINTKKIVVDNRFLNKGMYKIMFHSGNSTVSVMLNGYKVTEVK